MMSLWPRGEDFADGTRYWDLAGSEGIYLPQVTMGAVINGSGWECA
jgi:hypothetical protein